MTFARISYALVLILAGAAGAGAHPGEAGRTDSIQALADTSIPPNCTLNPWTHKYTCHKWPKRTTSRA